MREDMNSINFDTEQNGKASGWIPRLLVANNLKQGNRIAAHLTVDTILQLLSKTDVQDEHHVSNIS